MTSYTVYCPLLQAVPRDALVLTSNLPSIPQVLLGDNKKKLITPLGGASLGTSFACAGFSAGAAVHAMSLLSLGAAFTTEALFIALTVCAAICLVAAVTTGVVGVLRPPRFTFFPPALEGQQEEAGCCNAEIPSGFVSRFDWPPNRLQGDTGGNTSY